MLLPMVNSNYNPDVLNCIANLSNDEVFTPPELANRVLDLLPQEESDAYLLDHDPSEQQPAQKQKPKNTIPTPAPGGSPDSVG